MHFFKHIYNALCSTFWDAILLPKFTSCQWEDLTFFSVLCFKSAVGFCGVRYDLYVE